MIRILIVDDSDTEIAILKSIFVKEKDFEIVGFAKNGKEAIEIVPLLKPDLITMDISMPIMDGFEATSYIMSHNPTPIVIISSKVNDESLRATFRALEAGALGVLDKPVKITDPTFKYQRQRIIDTLRSMADIKVIKRRFNIKPKATEVVKIPTPNEIHEPEIVVIGSSVGGPQALKTIIGQLPYNFSLPVIIVQHMTPGFIDGFVKWLDANSSIKIKIAEKNEPLLSGTVYIAPDDYHIEVGRSHGRLIIKLISGEPVSGFCPSITTLFQSVAKICKANAIGILLTGMGHDGAKGLLSLKHAKSHTIIQDKESCVVFGMAGVAQTIGAVDKVIVLDKISEYLVELTDKAKV